MRKRSLSNTYLQVVSSTGDGMNLEMCMADKDGNLLAGEPYPIVSFRADTEGALLVEFFGTSGILEIPLEELERAIAEARREVHCEDFYDSNPSTT